MSSAAALVLLALPAAAPASCRSRIGDRGHVVTQTRSAVVYWRNDDPSIPRTYYGCEFRTGKLRRINRFQEQRAAQFKLAGHYLGFVLWSEEGASHELVQRLEVYDLRAGRYRLSLGAVRPPTPPGDRLEEVRSYVLKPNASVAWIAEYRPDPNDTATSFQVDKVETTREDGFRMLDGGETIGPRSIALADDGRRVYWRHGRAARSSTLR